MKILINTCFGGYGLSHECVLEYAKRLAMPIWPEPDEFRGFRYWRVPPGPSRLDLERRSWSEMSNEERHAWNAKYDEQVWYPERDIKRDDAVLIAVVEDLGSEICSGSHADLCVIEIPDGVDWIIKEYDGNEHVAERHRTWS